MDKKVVEIIEKYRVVRNEIDHKCDQLHLEHEKHTQCKKGCDQCCMNFSVLPLEFFSIVQALKANPPKQVNKEDPEKCLFLVDHSCQIYAHRPSICRSHGLPILNMDAEGENWELSYCPLNFTEASETYFTLDNGFQQDKFNSKFYILNQTFVKEFKDEKLSENQLLELRKLENYL